MRISFVAHSLRPGGTERQLVTLASGLAKEGHDVLVVVFRGTVVFEPELRGAGIRLHQIDRHAHWYRPAGLWNLVGVLRSWNPDVVHSYLVEPNLIVAVLRPLLRHARLVWGVRGADVEEALDARSRATLTATIPFSRVPDVIIVNSEAGRRHHSGRGYPERKMVVVPNGIDTDYYRPDPAGRRRVRDELGVPPESPLVGLVARLDPLKDHGTFLDAAAAVCEKEPDVRFVCVGGGPAPVRAQLEAFTSERGIRERVHWLGERSDLPAVYSALDVNCLSSLSEGFPNAVAEAMACGTPCVVTDVGDAARIVDGVGNIVARRSPTDLAEGISKLLARQAAEGEELSNQVRSRVVEEYSVSRLVERTVEVLEEIKRR
jgi:glycosyltransferase involved in cell wall biosynthesis